MLHHYFRSPASDHVVDQSLVCDYCSEKGLSGPEQSYVDDRAEADTPWPERKAGRELFSSLGAGDHIIVPSGGQVYTSAADLSSALGHIFGAGANVHFVAERLTLDPEHAPYAQIAVASFAMLTAFSKSESTKLGMARKQQQGLQHCSKPPTGFKWKGKKRSRVLAPDHEEQSVMKMMWGLSQAGHSFEAIYWHVRERKITRRDGSEWSLSAIKRAVKLMDSHAKGQGLSAPPRD